MTHETRKYKDVKDFLMSAEEALMEAKRVQRRVEQLSERCARLVRREGIGGAGEELQQLWKLLEEEKLRETEAVRREMERYREVAEFIDSLPDATCRTILRRRYLDGDTTWVRILFRLERDGVYYSERQVYRLHTTAMKLAESFWKDGGKTMTA